MFQLWKNEQGLTLIEVLAAVVILVLVAIPFTSMGTTLYRWSQEDAEKNRAVLFAEQLMQQQRAQFEKTGWIEAELEDSTGEWSQTFVQQELQAELVASPRLMPDAAGILHPIADLIDVQVTITGPDLEQLNHRKTITTLSTTIRHKTGGAP